MTNETKGIANAIKKVKPTLMTQDPWDIAQNTFQLCRETEYEKLKGWTFKKSRAKRRYGYCRYKTKTISVSPRLLNHASKEQIIDTVLHEVAHALVGPGYGHGHVWKNMARKLGANPKACADGKEYDSYNEWFKSNNFKYVRTCPNNCVIGYFENKPIRKIGLHRKSRKKWGCECGKIMELKTNLEYEQC